MRTKKKKKKKKMMIMMKFNSVIITDSEVFEKGLNWRIRAAVVMNCLNCVKLIGLIGQYPARCILQRL